MSKSLVLKPRMSEKTYALSQSENTFTFVVPTNANKLAVARAVAEQFDVTVKSVRMSKTSDKARRVYRRGGRTVQKGVSSGVKKAYVTLKEGDKLPIFAAIEEAEAEEAKAQAKAEAKEAKEKK